MKPWNGTSDGTPSIDAYLRLSFYAKGQLISECLFEKNVWTKIPTKNLIDSAHYTCWAESIKFFVGILVQTKTSKRHFEINWPLVTILKALSKFTRFWCANSSILTNRNGQLLNRNYLHGLSAKCIKWDYWIRNRHLWVQCIALWPEVISFIEFEGMQWRKIQPMFSWLTTSQISKSHQKFDMLSEPLTVLIHKLGSDLIKSFLTACQIFVGSLEFGKR